VIGIISNKICKAQQCKKTKPNSLQVRLKFSKTIFIKV